MTEELTRSVVEEAQGSAAIETSSLVARYGRNKTAVDGLDLSVPRGSVYGFLGSNGAGKTTTIKTLMGFRRPDGASVRMLGYDVVSESIEVRARVGFASEVESLYGGMTVPCICRFCWDMSRSWNQGWGIDISGCSGCPRTRRSADRFSLQTYWTNDGLYAGETFASMDILICLISAAESLLAALWIFNRKAY